MIHKVWTYFIDYVVLVVNMKFIIGMVLAYGARVAIGGASISYVSGAVAGLILFEVIRFFIYR